uniref:CSON000012 protein n=1 Tax=Culicoides sonorensis TaxID=179676 RepID=A0A336KY12_CULSO
MLKAASSPRPASWILEKSLDGEFFTPWQYFGISDDDCLRRYNLPGVSKPLNHVFRSDDEVICSTEYSKPQPYENSEIKVLLTKGRPGEHENSLKLLDFTWARYIRFRFQGMYMTQDSGVKWLVNDRDLLKRSYYSLRHIGIGGRCICNGHAAKCSVNQNDTDGHPKCDCIHNTCGDHCDKCCPLYNQRPYRPGNATHENRCEKCQCYGHATECRYSEDVDLRGLSINTKGKVSGGGVCVNCKHNTEGKNCERCVPGFYRPEGVPAYDPEPCRLCECYAEGTEGHCESMGGKCNCKEGFTGEKCDKCLPGYRGPKCEKCGCNPHGTMQGGQCESHCQCKLHVEGETCDKCVSGYFGLSADNDEGCIKCFCSGVTSNCKSLSNYTYRTYESYENWLVTDITNTAREYPVTDLNSGFLVFGNYELELEAIYWSAPHTYLGNKLTSYGSHFLFKIDWVVVRGDTSGKPTSGPDIILIGKNGLKIAFGDKAYEGTNATIDILLTQDGWYHVPKTVKDIITRQRRTEYKGDPVTRVQFMSVLSNLEAILLRGTYHTDQAECILHKSMLYVGDSNISAGNGSQSLVEKCDCPTGYTGTSCETCAFGYMKVYQNSSTHEQVGRCLPCNCNGHAETCDLETGKCGDCHHNTEGETCDRCKAGFYGNALEGTPNDCQKCACPLSDSSNNFSPTCRIKDVALDENHLEKNWPLRSPSKYDYICTACPIGYHGDHCEFCDDGFYGDPTELGSQCLPCPCNGGPCDPKTGLCITCQGNTEGWRCEKCKPGFWGNAIEGCYECECYDQGSVSNVCDRITGKCECRERYSGVHCQECDLGFANLSEDCAPCDCHTNGSHNHVCDPDTGLCSCKEGVYGAKCDNCIEEYFNLTADGCEGKWMINFLIKI